MKYLHKMKGPRKITTNSSNYILGKSHLDLYEPIANTDRSTNLFIKDFRVVAGCFPIDLKKKKILMIKHKKGGNFIIPKGGIEFDELRYKKMACKTPQNFEDIPGVTYCFREGALRETWEEAGVKGKVTKDLGFFYYTDSSNTNENYQAWVNRKPKKFTKSIEYYYQMEVDEVCTSWPEEDKRIQKWVDLDQAVWNLVSNGRFLAFKALLNTDLVKDKDELYAKYFKSDLNEEKYKVYFRNRPYKKFSEEICEASVSVVDIILNKSGDKIMVNNDGSIDHESVEMMDEPFIWRSSTFFKWLKENKNDSVKFKSLKEPVGYVRKNKDSKSDGLEFMDLGTYEYAVNCCVYEVDDSLEMKGRKWVSVSEWKKKTTGVGNIVKRFLEHDEDELIAQLENMEI